MWWIWVKYKRGWPVSHNWRAEIFYWPLCQILKLAVSLFYYVSFYLYGINMCLRRFMKRTLCALWGKIWWGKKGVALSFTGTVGWRREGGELDLIYSVILESCSSSSSSSVPFSKKAVHKAGSKGLVKQLIAYIIYIRYSAGVCDMPAFFYLRGQARSITLLLNCPMSISLYDCSTYISFCHASNSRYSHSQPHHFT